MTQLAPATWHRLDHLGMLLVTGPEARTYLQGQLSFDLNRLSGERMELATCNSPQGRVQAILWLIERTDGIALLLPTSMLETTLTRLKKYVLRAKVKIETGTERFQLCGARIGAIEGGSRAHRQTGDRSEVNWPGAEPRVLSLVERSLEVASDPAFVEAWRRADIAAGLPQVYPQTHEAFVAQMLNADLLGGIGFEKGCYTGQEIIARTHFRGAIKRRMFRFRADCAPPAPGTRLVVGEQHAGDVVDAAAANDGCELLAVVSLSLIDEAIALDTSDRSPLTRLPLPYQV